jgi:guanylate kinase
MKKLLILVGASAVGKSSVMLELCKNIKARHITSFTTRGKRIDDCTSNIINISRNAFEDMAHNNELLSINNIYNNYYGYAREQTFAEDEVAIALWRMTGDTKQDNEFMAWAGDKLVIYLDGSNDVIKQRLMLRGTGVSESRLNDIELNARTKQEHMHFIDYIINTDDINPSQVASRIIEVAYLRRFFTDAHFKEFSQ